MLRQHRAAVADAFLEQVQNITIPTGMTLMHLATHIAHHPGQLDYYLRCVGGDATTVGTLPVSALVAPFPTDNPHA